MREGDSKRFFTLAKPVAPNANYASPMLGYALLQGDLIAATLNQIELSLKS